MNNPLTMEQYTEMLKASGQLETKEYMTIPMAVHRMNISIGAKYLYGILYGFIRTGVVYASNEWLMNELGCKDIKTLHKWINELKKNGAIVVTTNSKGHREIECKITEKVVLMSEAEIEEQYKAYTSKLNATPEYVQDFIKGIK